MAKKTAPKETLLTIAAKKLGEAAGKLAALAGTTPAPVPARASAKRGKLLKKDKTRIPRRQKKAQQKSSLH